MIGFNLILFLAFLIGLNPGALARRHRQQEPDMELKMHWKDLSLKTICEEEEWRAQFEPVRDKFTKCLGLKKLFMEDNDPEDDGDRLGMFRSENNNPYCRIAQTWDACSHHLKGLNCIEPNSEEISRGNREGLSGMIEDSKHYDPEDMNSMVKPYRMQCEMAKFAYNYGPFGSHGMDYYGGMGMDYGEGEEMPPIPHEGDF